MRAAARFVQPGDLMLARLLYVSGLCSRSPDSADVGATGASGRYIGPPWVARMGPPGRL